MYWIHPDYPDAASIFHSHLNRLIQMTNKKNGTPVYICIGTPAIIGDCLGPVIGTIPVRIPSGAGLRNTGRPDSRTEF